MAETLQPNDSNVFVEKETNSTAKACTDLNAQIKKHVAYPKNKMSKVVQQSGGYNISNDKTIENNTMNVNAEAGITKDHEKSENNQVNSFKWDYYQLDVRHLNE